MGICQLKVKAKLTGFLVAATVSAALGSLATNRPASADPTATTNYVGVGSEEIQDLFNAYSGAAPAPPSSLVKFYTPLHSNPASGNKGVSSFDAFPAGGSASSPGCIVTKYGGGAFDRPSGTSNGILALQDVIAVPPAGFKNALGSCTGVPRPVAGQVDFARSSRGPAAGTSPCMMTPCLTYIPFARGAVSVGYFDHATNNLATLSTTQLKALYTSPTGTIIVGTDTVKACLTRSGVGTTKFFEGAIGVSDVQAVAAATASGCYSSSGLAVGIEENGGDAFYNYARNLPAGTDAVIDFSASSWITQANAVALDRSALARANGVDLSTLDGLPKPYTGTPPNDVPTSTFYASTMYGHDMYVVVPDRKVSGFPPDPGIKSLFAGAGAAICAPANQTTARRFGFSASSNPCGATNIIASFAPTLGSISGIVSDTAGTALVGVSVRVCTSAQPQVCQTSVSDGFGAYGAADLSPGTYQVDADPPSGFLPGHAGPITINASQAIVNLTLLASTPLPPGVNLPGAHAGNGPPIVNWGQPTPFNLGGRCPNGSANFAITQNNMVIASGPMTEIPPGSGTYTGIIPPFAPNNHGYAQVTVTVVCPDDSTQVVPFLIYIDPSGTVLSPTGAPIDGATVTLLSSASAQGPFTPVPNGSPVMSPANQTNPGVTNTTGHFGWDTVAGFYQVQARKSGCVTPTNPTAPVAVTPVLTVPPAATGLVLTLDCSASPAPTITSADSANFTAGTAGTFTVTATGTPTPGLSESGALPTGVTFTPNADGTATLTVGANAPAGSTFLSLTAANGITPDAPQAFALTIRPGPPAPAITSASSAGFAAGAAGTFTVTATGTPNPNLTETGALPTGVTFTANANGTATIAVGANTALGTTSVTITAANGVSPNATQALTLTISPPAPAIPSPSSASFTLSSGVAGTFAVTATGTPTPNLSETGALPVGVTFTPNANGTATLAVAPTTAPGTTTFTITGANGVNPNATQPFTLTINPPQ